MVRENVKSLAVVSSCFLLLSLPGGRVTPTNFESRQQTFIPHMVFPFSALHSGYLAPGRGGTIAGRCMLLILLGFSLLNCNGVLKSVTCVEPNDNHLGNLLFNIKSELCISLKMICAYFLNAKYMHHICDHHRHYHIDDFFFGSLSLHH